MPVDSMSGEALFLVCRHLLAVSSHGGGRGSQFSGLFLEGHKSHHEDSTLPSSSKPHYLPKTPLPNGITFGLVTSTYEYKGEGGT